MPPVERRPAEPDRTLRHPSGVTDFYIGCDALDRAHQALADWTSGRTAFVISSPPVVERQAAAVAAIESLADEAQRLLVADGEAAKTLASAERLWSAMLEAGGGRDSRVIAIGGGSVGDVAGFVAATFLRGVELALVPTTLLSQVDAAVGGKTAIDMPQSKNSVGAFWHPRLVVADIALLASLEPAEWRSGMVEIIKIAAAADQELFERLERQVAPGGVLDGGLDRGLVEAMVESAITTKIGIVEGDPNEDDRRRVLNLGHTLGHAIEAALGYRGLRHGEAVGYGLLFALRLAVERGGDRSFARRCADLLRRLELPPLPDLEPTDLSGAMRRDKKVRREGLFWVLPVGLGQIEVTTLDPDRVTETLVAFLDDPWSV